MTSPQPKRYRLLIGSDAAGADHKRQLSDDLRRDPRVSSLVDVSSVNELVDDVSYSHVGIAAGLTIAGSSQSRV